MKTLFPFVVCLFSCLVCSNRSAYAATILTNGSAWRYFIGTQEASTPTTAWRQIDFNDAAWSSADFPIGYAVPANDPGGYEATIRTTLPTSTVGNYTTVYLRKTFVLGNPANFAQLKLDIVVDDGYVVWVNGTEVGRYNAPGGQLAFNATASGQPEATLTTVNVNAGNYLVSGTNVIAIHLLNGALSSSDLFLDAAVSGDSAAPTLASVVPTPGSVGSLSQIAVTFSAPVTGVDASDLLINGQPANAVTGGSNSYVFSFVQPASGTVQISWSATHGIQDFANPPNAFNATASGSTWQYDLQDRTAPQVASLVPQAGFVVRSLTQIDVHFTEPVQGVSADDLQINGTPAVGVTSLDPNRYLFTFPQPATGFVQVAWSLNHGISDRAFPSNAFLAGPAWAYLLNPNEPPSDIIISEFLAAETSWRGSGSPPSTKVADEEGDYPDWIEIYNITASAINLDGWHLTDAPNNLAKWSFPPTNLPAKSYMIVFASEKNRAIPGRPLHTNFKLSNNGEYLALVKPDGRTIATSFAPTYPVQVDDVSYGFPTLSSATNLVTTSSLVSAYVPTNGNLLLNWTSQNFNDATWIHGTNGVGFETATNPAPSLRSFIRTDVQTQMFGRNASIFVRLPFYVDDIAKVDALTVRLRYDDGFVAYVNGLEVARRNAPTNELNQPLLWNEHATARRLNNVSTNAEDIDLSSLIRQGGIQTGTNVLAIHGLNWSQDEGDFLLSAEVIGIRREIQLTQNRYFPAPTPGADNGIGTENLGPIISDSTASPTIPRDDDNILVTARITPTFAPVSQVTLNYRIMFGAETAIPMLDDGQHGDGGVGDGIYGATIPAASLSTPGQMVRWFIRASDNLARSSRLPTFQDTNNSPQYLGTMVFAPETNNLPVLHLFIPDSVLNQANNDGAGRYSCSVFYLGEFYDNCGINRHGQSSAGFPKKSYDIDFNPGYSFRYALDQERVDDVNLLTPYPDKADMRNMLAYRVYKDAGAPYHFVIPVRVQTNGGFYGDWHLVENGDENFLKRLGKDPNGALYKMYNTFMDPVLHVQISSSQAEKKTRKQEGNADLVALMAGIQGGSKFTYIYDNLNIPQMINYLAARIITGDVDCCHKNYYFYRDSEGTGEWEGFPWDVDLSFGRVWDSGNTYWNQALIPTTGLDIGQNNGVFSLLLNGTAQTRQMYLRRIRTLMDEQFGPASAPVLNFEAQVDYWLPQLAPDAALDSVKWPFSDTWGQASATSTCCRQSIQEAAGEIKTNYLAQRRAYLYSLSLPLAQPSNAVVQIRSLDYAPASGNQAQEYVELYNPNIYAVDISGWKISGGIDYTFQAGVVIPSSTSLYLSQDVKAWRARTNGPSGGQGLFVQGNYKGQLSARGETLLLTDKTGRQVATLAYPGNPSLPQQYLRITELMYHPSPLAGNTNAADEFEYVELKNIGSVSLNLTGVRFVEGILFDFTGSSVTNLGPGQTVLVVKNAATFSARYGGASSIAGQYTGNLDNAGERLRLVDALGEEILDFDYNNTWYPVTDGLGFSLAIINEQDEPDNWTLKSHWRPSGRQYGSPGQNDPSPLVVRPILVNEALTRTANVPDSVEFYNPNTNAVDISGWYLSDDYNAPNKYRIPDGTVIPGGGFRVFTESNFNANPALPSSFALGGDGDEVYLFAVDTNGYLSGYVHGFRFGAAEEGVPFGRYVTSEGKEHFVAQTALTLNAPNAGPKVGPVVLSEVMYHPPDVGTNDNTDDEFIELLNITGSPVTLFDPTWPTNTWKLSGGIDFVFPTNTSLASGEVVLVVNFAPTNTALLGTFRAKFNVSTNVRVFGPYSGKLNNDADTVALSKPTAPVTNLLSIVAPYALVDSLEYQDSAPWAKAADGLGYSLQRWNVRTFGDEPTNWVAARPTAAAPTFTNGVLPQFTLQPNSQALLVGQSSLLSAAVVGSPPLTAQWRLNGTNLLGKTNLSLALTNIQLSDAGDYEIVVNNLVGSVFSQKATITVRFPVFILQHPQPVEVRVPPDPSAAPTTNVTFTVSAYSVSPVRIQWRRNGTAIPGATNDSFTVINVQTNDLGYFSAVVSDDISTAESSNAWLYPLISPNFIEQPISQSVAGGSRVTLSASASGWPPPFTFEWRLGAATLAASTNDDPTAFFSATVPTNVPSVSYRVIVRNRALPSGRISGFAVITILPDSDGDGLPDEWEIARGLNPNSALDRLGDADGDGMLNWQEFEAGTDPTNALSRLKIDSLSWSNGAVSLGFQAVSNKTYAIQYTPSLSVTNWQTLLGIVGRRTNRTEVVVDPLHVTNRFYRLVTPTPTP